MAWTPSSTNALFWAGMGILVAGSVFAMVYLNMLWASPRFVVLFTVLPFVVLFVLAIGLAYAPNVPFAAVLWSSVGALALPIAVALGFVIVKTVRRIRK